MSLSVQVCQALRTNLKISSEVFYSLYNRAAVAARKNVKLKTEHGKRIFKVASNMSRALTDIGHADMILLKLWKQCENEELCDAILIAGTDEKIIPAHRCVLSAVSEYFDEMFAASMRESTSKKVKMPSVDGDILQRLVEYCYTGRVVISEEIVVQLLTTAYELHLVNVVAACEKFLLEHLYPSNCLGLEVLAEHYCCKALLEEARCYSLENFLEVCEMSEFLRLNADQLSQLLAADDLCVRTEEDVFNSLIRWIEHDRKEREKYLTELLKVVRMPLLERSFLIQNVKPICDAIGCLKIYMEAIEGHLLPGSTKLSRSKPVKRRKSNQVLMAISLGKSDNKMFLHYYCPQRNEWMKWLKDLEYRIAFNVAVIKDYLIIAGGQDNKNTILNTVIRLNLRTMILKQMTPMNEYRSSCCAATLNKVLYVVGGYNGKKALSSVEKWNQERNKWDVAASMLTSRYGFRIAVLNGKLYVVGGKTSDRISLNSAECYDPIQNVWTFIESMSESRNVPGVVAANGMLYAVGGHGNKTVERYDPETNQWTMMCRLREELIDPGSCTLLGDKVVVYHEDGIEEFDAATNKWKEIMAVKRPDQMNDIFSYSDKILTSEFAKN